MLFDPLTIGAVLAVAGAKVKGADVTFGGLLSNVVANVAHPHIEDLRKRIITFLNEPNYDKNMDLERAVARSAAHADLFCLMEALHEPLDRPRGAAAWFDRMWERCPDTVKNLRQSIQTLFPAAERDLLGRMKEVCLRRLKAIEGADFKPQPIDPFRLRVDMRRDYGLQLAKAAMKGLEADYGGQLLPEAARKIFEDRWFAHLCSSFSYEVKHNEPIFKIYQKIAFERLERLVREEGYKTRIHTAREGARTRAILGGKIERIGAGLDRLQPQRRETSYSLPARGLFIGRDEELQTARARWFQDRTHPLLICGPPGIGKSKLGLALLHDDAVAKKFGARRYQLRCDEYKSARDLISGMGKEWFGLTPRDTIEGEVISELKRGECAVLVDNFETPYRDTAASEAWLHRLLGVDGLWLIAGYKEATRNGRGACRGRSRFS